MGTGSTVALLDRSGALLLGAVSPVGCGDSVPANNRPVSGFDERRSASGQAVQPDALRTQRTVVGHDPARPHRAGCSDRRHRRGLVAHIALTFSDRTCQSGQVEADVFSFGLSEQEND